ncbi:M23 family metallopeptidase [Paracoccus sp. S1E-3]|uniref:M23 family metallopeptidase n=1 Tax=Paracoccus sp. S1E-3 TaxID=2756130 RepID=UPI0015EFCED5|nr:M23 family metallopeptidase [Paracoccus sp. S1E-3]MBA4489907.1 peptidoglycan DD-metalloendopeptidase family protein [Paracoccus sp. S1E-3]
MSSTIFRGMVTLSLTVVLAGCQAFPAVQQDMAAIGNGISARVPQPSGATSMPGIPGMGASAGGGGAATAGPSVTDPYAGQGVAKPNVPGGGNVKPTQTPSAQVAVTPATTHQVTSGETGWSVARKYGITIQDLAAANNLETNMVLKVGQTLKIPARRTATASDASAPGQGTPTPMPPSAAKPLPDEKTAPSTAPVAKPSTPDLGATRTAASGSGKMRMPVAGSITRTFNKGSNDGIDISAPTGTEVQAAGSGRVAAITRDTDGVPIVVIRHEGELMTVYAGMSQLSVQKGDQVKAGQKIGTAGNSGAIHFEVRKGFDAVNPENYL